MELSIQKWKYRTAIIKIVEGKFQINIASSKVPSKVLKGQKEVIGFANGLGEKGWELVGVVPKIGGDWKSPGLGGIADMGRHLETRSTGYYLWFKQPVE